MSSDIAHSQSSRVNEGEEAFKSQIVPGSGIPKSGGGEGMKKGIDENIRLGGEGLDNCLATGTLDGLLSMAKANGGVFGTTDIFAVAEYLASVKISYSDFFEAAKKNLLKLGDMSLVEGTGFKLGAALSPISSGQGQEH